MLRLKTQRRIRLHPTVGMHKAKTMKNSTRRTIRRLTIPCVITLLAALAVPGVTRLFRNSITEAARAGKIKHS